MELFFFRLFSWIQYARAIMQDRVDPPRHLQRLLSQMDFYIFRGKVVNVPSLRWPQLGNWAAYLRTHTRIRTITWSEYGKTGQDSVFLPSGRVLVFVARWRSTVPSTLMRRSRFIPAAFLLDFQLFPKCQPQFRPPWYRKMSDRSAGATSVVGAAGGKRTKSPPPPLVCLLTFDLLPHVSRRMDDQERALRRKRACRSPLSNFVAFFFFFSLLVFNN